MAGKPQLAGVTTVVRVLQQHGPAAGANWGPGPVVTVRRDEYKGHEIEVRATCEVLVDGKPIASPILVDEDGLPHYRPLPHYSWPSAISMARQVIDKLDEG
jgi:hypothetical protein